MPKQTSSQSAIFQRRQAQRVAGTPTKRFGCPVKGCNYLFLNSTDVSRHKWNHLPHHLLPPCPSGDAGCPTKYRGRSEKMRAHMKSRHNTILSKNHQWPKLNDLFEENGLELIEKDIPVLSPVASPTTVSQPLPASATSGDDLSQDLNFECFDNTQKFIQWPLLQHVFVPQANAADEAYLQPQPLTPPLSGSRSPSTSRDSPYPDLFTSSSYSVPYSSVGGPHAAAQGLLFSEQIFDTRSLEQQLEDLDFSKFLEPPQISVSSDTWDWSTFTNEPAHRFGSP